jgi:hypothetical protein
MQGEIKVYITDTELSDHNAVWIDINKEGGERRIKTNINWVKDDQKIEWNARKAIGSLLR